MGQEVRREESVISNVWARGGGGLYPDVTARYRGRKLALHLQIPNILLLG